MGHADSARRGVRDPGEDVHLPRGDGLQGWRELPGEGHLGDGSDASHRGLALVAGQGHDAQADGRLLGAPACQRGVVHEPRAQAGRAAADRSHVPREAEQGERRHPSDHQS